MLNLSIADPNINQAIYNLLRDYRAQNKNINSICDEMSVFITNILKLNARQLLNKKAKQKKTSRNFLSNTSIASALTLESVSATPSELTIKNQSMQSMGPRAQTRQQGSKPSSATPGKVLYREYSFNALNNSLNIENDFKHLPGKLRINKTI
jgi:hypothetical protein